MITNICNLQHEGHIDTFLKVVLLKAEYLRSFDRTMSVLALQEVFSNLVESVEGIDMELLPDNVNISHMAINGPSGSEYRTEASFFMSPQTTETQNILEAFNNKEVVALFHKNNNIHIYGTKAQPLTVSYNEVNGNRAGSLKGYTLNVKGTTTTASIYLPSTALAVINKGLAFQLARQL